jgi:hypothetical protein
MSGRLETAEALLREAVFRSRASQATSGVLAPSSADVKGRCGLGERAVVVLDLSPEAAAHFARLWPVDPDARALERIRDVIADWVQAQDALDRKRNHFLKAFRNAHGSDRRAYTPDETAEYDAGLERINVEENEKRRAAAGALVAGS